MRGSNSVSLTALATKNQSCPLIGSHGTWHRHALSPQIGSLRLQREDLEIAQRLIRKHLAYTGSDRAREILHKWEDCASRFVKVHPRDLKRALAARLEIEGGDG